MDTTQINPEALLAVVGVRRLISGDIGKITVADKNAAAMFPREVRRACARFCDPDAEIEKFKQGAFDFGKLSEQISAAVNPDPEAVGTIAPALAEDISAAFRPEDHDLAAGFLVVVQRVIPYLQSIMPSRTEQTMSRTVSYDPSDTEIARWRRAFDVADGAMIVLQDMERLALVADQVVHLSVCCPDTYALVKAMMGAEMAAALGRKKSWKLSWQKDRQVQVLYQEDTFSSSLQQDLQASFAQQQSPKPGPPPAKSSGKTASMVQPKTSMVTDGDVAK